MSAPGLTQRMSLALTVPALVLGLGACAPTTRPEAAEARRGPTTTAAPLVLTTFTVTADMARRVAGDRLRVESLTKPGAEIHGYDPTPQDVRKARDAALILDNGLGLELWFDRFTASSGARRATLTRGITPIPIAGGAARGHPNPHAWMSPALGVRYVDNIVEAFSALDPAGEKEYRARGGAYRAEIAKVGTDLAATLAKIPPDKRALVTCEGAFSYLARDAGLSEHYLWPVNAESEPTPQSTAEVVETVRSRGVPAVFCESTVSDTVQRQVAAQTGARYGGALYVDSLSEEGGPVPTYLDLLRHDASTIASALTGTS